jgi:hypothetical protein
LTGFLLLKYFINLCSSYFDVKDRFMLIKDVPQDNGLNKGMSEITYAVDENGRYIGVQSLGWEPKNVVNTKAWDVISDEVAIQVELVRTGKKSPLAYYMTRNLMSVALLADYVGLPRWRVRRHMKPSVFNRLKPQILQRYAELFGISCEEIRRIPQNDTFYQSGNTAE